MKKTICWTLRGMLLFCFLLLCTKSEAARTVRIATGLSRPVFVTSPAEDFDRLFIVEQQTAVIKILNLYDYSINAIPFLNIDSLVINTGNERGLLGLAFHPDFSENGYFFVSYVNNSNQSVIRRYQVSATNPDSARHDNALTIITIPQPSYDNHKGGMIAFSPLDGYLYIGMGDGGLFNDPGERSQSDTTLLGKMLRIDVDNGTPYTIPASNPYSAPGNPRDEIYMKGLRNPWRYSFDRLTGDLWIADVGQDNWEEVDFHPADSAGGQNYGWDCTEGTHCLTGDVGCACPNAAHTLPVHEYSHAGGNCSVTGGYIYHGCAIPEFTGLYFFADYCTANIWSFRLVDNTVTEFTNRTVQFVPVGGGTITSLASFGEDAAGELYICDLFGGEIFKIVPDTLLDCNDNNRSDSCDIALGIAADLNHNFVIDNCECVPLAPIDLVCSLIGENLQLNWTAVGSGLESYSVYRSQTDEAFPGPSWDAIVTGLPSLSGANAMSYTDLSIIAGAEKNYYIVVSVCPN